MILGDLELLSFDVAAAEVYGPLRARLERKGLKLDEADLRIASIALVHDCTLITGNVRHFARLDELRVENWLKD
jgi:tRNA(fMet)-specific endonuclease VapC